MCVCDMCSQIYSMTIEMLIIVELVCVRGPHWAIGIRQILLTAKLSFKNDHSSVFEK